MSSSSDHHYVCYVFVNLSLCIHFCVCLFVCLRAHAGMCLCGWRSCPCAEAPPPPLQAQGSRAVSLLPGIGSLINFISVCGGEQLLPVCAGEDVENVLVSLSLLQCKWNKNESNHSQMCPKVFNNHHNPNWSRYEPPPKPPVSVKSLMLRKRNCGDVVSLY